jgi:hypothetical protein
MTSAARKPGRRHTLALVISLLAMLAADTAHAIIVARRAVYYRPYPIARTAAVVGTAAVTAAVVGSVVSSVPPSCTSTMVGNVAYQQCGNTWYRPQYMGSTVNYIVVNPPR